MNRLIIIAAVLILIALLGVLLAPALASFVRTSADGMHQGEYRHPSQDVPARDVKGIRIGHRLPAPGI